MITIEAMLKEGRESGEPNPVRWGPYRKRRLGQRTDPMTIMGQGNHLQVKERKLPSKSNLLSP